MKTKHFTLLFLLLAVTANLFAQCIIPITDGQSYSEDFESGTMECWTVEATGSATWAVMTGSASSVAAFQNASVGDEARLISPTFDLSGVSGATFSFGYAMMALYNNDVLTVSYRSSETDSWHELGNYSFSDWSNVYEETFDLPEISSTYQISFLGYSNGGYHIFIDNIEIIGAGGCARPVNMQATNITAFSALLGWSTTGNEESWIIDLNGNQQSVDVQPFLLEDLDPQTEYSVRVKAVCGGGMESEWSYPITFKTFCDVITVTNDAPYFDDFEASEDFVCWRNEIELGEDGWVIDPGYLFPNNTAFFIWLGQEAWLVSAPLDLSAVTSPALTFKHKQPHGDDYNADELSVWYASSLDDYWHLLGEYTEITDDWETATFALPEPSATYYIGFKGKANNANGVYVDDVWVGNDPDVGVAETPAVKVVVSPNPATEKVTIAANVTKGTIDVFDMTGRTMATVALDEGRTEIDLSGFAQGVYIARVSNDDGITTVKIIKE